MGVTVGVETHKIGHIRVGSPSPEKSRGPQEKREAKLTWGCWSEVVAVVETCIVSAA